MAPSSRPTAGGWAAGGALPRPSADWWQALVYQVYPRSFADSNGDGIGDLRGITDRIPYLASLSIDAVWLSPFYPSALADGGYDVDDYRGVDPRLGSLADFDELVATLHSAGIRLIVDIVPNHSSNLHEWFRAALASPPGSPERARYLFRDGTGPNRSEPPSDWQSLFGGSAWEPVGDGQFYLHLFAPEQPDLNWDDPSVRADFDTTLRFWGDHGVDGFRVDVAHGLAKDIRDPMLPHAGLETLFGGASHPLWDRDEVHTIYRGWRKIFDQYDPPLMAVAEAAVKDPERRAVYASPDNLGQAFNFDLMDAGYNADSYRAIIAENVAIARSSGSSSTWVFENHDSTRHATRFGLPLAAAGGVEEAKNWLLRGAPPEEFDHELGLRRARAASLMMLALPGSAYLYQGEELGLHEVAAIPSSQRQDPSFFRNPTKEVGRDGCRVPLPWARDRTAGGGSSFGFGSDGAHLPQPDWFGDVSDEAQDGAIGSTLMLYRTALRWRRSLQATATLEWAGVGTASAGSSAGSISVLHFVRPGGWHSITNFGPDPVDLPTGKVIVASEELAGGKLPADTTAWVVTSGLPGNASG